MTRHHRPEWHEPVQQIGGSLNDPIEDTVETGSVQLVDGPIDAVPLSTGKSSRENYHPPRHSAGPMPDLPKSVLGSALETLKSSTINAGSATKSALSVAAGKVGEISVSRAKTAGSVLWDITQRNPRQVILLVACVIWLLRSNKTTASRPTADLPDAAQKLEQASKAQGWFGQTLQSHPLTLGAIALVFGAALGFAVPETAQEHQWMGKTRDKLAAQAQEAALDLAEKVQTVAQAAVHEAIETVKEEAKNQGLLV